MTERPTTPDADATPAQGRGKGSPSLACSRFAEDTPWTNCRVIRQDQHLIQVDGRDVVWANDARNLERQRNALVAALKAVVTHEASAGWDDTEELLRVIEDAIISSENEPAEARREVPPTRQDG